MGMESPHKANAARPEGRLDPARPVRVYRNLTRNTWSVQQGGLVVAHLDRVALRSVRMVVQPGGQRRVRDSGHKHVHAFLEGVLIDSAPQGALAITYNPHTDAGFCYRDGPSDRTLEYADFAVLGEGGGAAILGGRYAPGLVDEAASW